MRVILINIWELKDHRSAPLDAKPLNPEPVPLATLRKGSGGLVVAVLEGDAGIVSDEAGATIGRRLVEIGFVPGERVRVIEEVWPGGDPMAVRVGSTVFALRRREARSVLVQVGRE
ncbi:MAG: ferrous iron transport protein A [Gammaproteobacteria bacterium]|nr:ferrous iron transport protein A [Gammaproteobacteria bacterium]MDE2250397.1 ferrous iron transport protein A [Gammaproteobacteria bacterium]